MQSQHVDTTFVSGDDTTTPSSLTSTRTLQKQQQQQQQQQHYHFKMYKPFQCLTQFVYTHSHKQRKRKGCCLLGDIYNKFPAGVMAIGRLDKDSEGLLMITTDGRLSNSIRSKAIEKEYYVQVKGIVTDEALERLRQGIEISTKGTSNTASTGTATVTTNGGSVNKNVDSFEIATKCTTYLTLPCKATRLETHEVVEVQQHEPTAAATAAAAAAATGRSPKKRKRKFKGVCRNCGLSTGHRAADCTATKTNISDIGCTDGKQATKEETRIETETEVLRPPPATYADAKKKTTATSVVHHHYHRHQLPLGIPPPGRIVLDESCHGPTSWVSITVTEGKFRQVRKMTAAVGFPCLRLVRVRIGSVSLQGMDVGEVQSLQESEILG